MGTTTRKSVDGAFGATGQSATVNGKKGIVKLNFGTGTVKIRTRMDLADAWVYTTDSSGSEESWTADAVIVIDSLCRS